MGTVGDGQSNGNANWAARAVFQVVVGLFLVMLTAIVGVIWTRQDRLDAALQLQWVQSSQNTQNIEYLKQRASEEKARTDELYRNLYRLPAALPHERGPR